MSRRLLTLLRDKHLFKNVFLERSVGEGLRMRAVCEVYVAQRRRRYERRVDRRNF